VIGVVADVSNADAVVGLLKMKLLILKSAFIYKIITCMM
jgi:hypothetical protein